MTKPRLFQCIDFDRTLFDTAAFTKALTDEVERRRPGLGAELEAKFEAAYKKEETFFLLRTLREAFGDEAFESMVRDLAGPAHKDGATHAFLLPGALKRIRVASTLSELDASWGILTYGDSIDQLLKLSIAGLTGARVLIADTPDKSELLTSWQQEDGRYHLPPELGGEIAESITLEDDKIRAFEGLPQRAYGIWVTQDPCPELTLKQKGLTQVVTPVTSVEASVSVIEQVVRS